MLRSNIKYNENYYNFNNKDSLKLDVSIPNFLCNKDIEQFYIGQISITLLKENSYDEMGYIIAQGELKDNRISINISELCSKYQNKGYGTLLFKSLLKITSKLIDISREEKFEVSDTFIVTGNLSKADKDIGNWNKSLPFYSSLNERIDTYNFNFNLFNNDKKIYLDFENFKDTCEEGFFKISITKKG